MLTGWPPFYSEVEKDMFDRIKFKRLKFPEDFSEDCKSLLSMLFVKNPDKRLGNEGALEVKEHPFFSDINWDELIRREIKPPFIPNIKSDLDITNFDNVLFYFS